MSGLARYAESLTDILPAGSIFFPCGHDLSTSTPVRSLCDR
jgi:hypothetical protein